MAYPTITPEIAHAAGTDAGNRSMRAACRTKWNDDDWNVAARTTNRLLLWTFPADVREKIRVELEAQGDI